MTPWRLNTRSSKSAARSKNGRIEDPENDDRGICRTVEVPDIQIDATDRQIDLINEQRSAIATLVDKGFAQRSKLIEIDSRLSELARRAESLSAQEPRPKKPKQAPNLR